MTNLLYVSLAYKAAALQLMLSEANFVSDRLHLHTPHPIQITDVTHFVVGPPGLNRPGGMIETTNFYFSIGFKGDFRLFIDTKDNPLGQFDLYPVLAKTPSLINSNQAWQLATQWLGAIDVDVNRLEQKYGKERQVEQEWFWNQPGLDVVHPPGDTNKTMLPVFTVTWSKPEPDGRENPVTVKILGTTKELMSLRVLDSTLSRRPPLEITNADYLNSLPDPPVKHLELRPPAVNGTNAPPGQSTNSPARPPPFLIEIKNDKTNGSP